MWHFSPVLVTAWKVYKYVVFSGQYFSGLGLNTDQKKLRIWTLFTQCICRKVQNNVQSSVISDYFQTISNQLKNWKFKNDRKKRLTHFMPMFFFYTPPLKTSENHKLSDVFRGYRKGTLAWKGLKNIAKKIFFISWLSKKFQGKIKRSFLINYTLFLYKQRFFFISPSVLLSFLMNWASNVA